MSVVPTHARSAPGSVQVADSPSGQASQMNFSSTNRSVLKELYLSKLCIQFVRGDITEECLDGLVNVASPGPKLLDTGLQGAFLKKGGQRLQLAYMATTKGKGNLTKGKVIETAGPVGELKCKMVCHICPPDGHKELKGIV